MASASRANRRTRMRPSCFTNFCMTDAQAIFLQRDFVPTSKKIESPLTKIPLKFVDVKTSLDDDAKWSKLYNDIITKQSK